MGNMNIMGSYSGIGMDTVDQLIEAEKSKGVQFTNKKSKIEKEQSAWKDVSTRLDSLYKNIEKLQNPETFQSLTVKSSIKESPFLSVTGNKNAAAGQYRMEVKHLASASRVTGENFEGEAVGGNIYIKTEGKEAWTTVPTEAGASLKDISENINAKTEESGIKASIVDNRLILTNTETGKDNVEVTINSVAKSLGFTGDEKQLTDGKDAKLIIDGLTITRSSNTIDDVIEGLTINLTDIHEGKSELITVAQDTEKTVKAVKEFVDQYNSVMSFIDEQTDFGDPSLENNKSGALAGESSVTRLQSSLRSMLSQNLKDVADGGVKNISELGIEIDRYGKATIDSAKLNEAVREDPANVGRFFYQPATAGVEGAVGAAGEKTPKAGMSELLKNFVDTYTSSSKGLIKTTKESNDRMLKDIEKQIETFNKRIDKKRDRYIREFTALDQAMMQAESQMDFLYTQLGMDNN